MGTGRENLRSLLRREYGGVLLLLIMWACTFSRTLTDQGVYFLDDLKIIYYPLEHAYAEFQARGDIPAWSPLFGFGHPLIAWGQLGFFTPLHMVLRALQFHPLALLQTSILTYFLLGSLGMYGFLRRWHLSPIAAALGGILYAYTGFHIGHLNHVNFYTATMLLPFLLWAADRLITKPTAARSAAVALLGAAMALSGQPQVVLYSFIIAAVFTAIISVSRLRAASSWWPQAIRIGGGLLIAALVALLLSSWAILPLLEFLPLTERASDGTIEELLDFSYPPFNTITLVLPYFFGGHADYQGPKGFQELAAFTGLLPLLLAGAALVSWKDRRPLHLLGLLLIISAFLFAAGKYSPLYRTLIEQRIITNLNIPGRFVFYFTTGVSMLAALAVDELPRLNRRRRAAVLAAGTLGTLVLLAPALAMFGQQITGYLRTVPATAIGIGMSILVAPLAVLLPARAWQLSCVIIASGLLVMYGWHFNPLTSSTIALAPSPLADSFSPAGPLPPRLYARSHLLQQRPQAAARTDPITPDFSVFWPLAVDHDNFSCLNLPVYVNEHSRGTADIRIFTELSEPPVRTLRLDTARLTTFDQRLCFSPIRSSAGRTFFIAVTSSTETGLRLLSRPEAETTKQAYLTRIANPTHEDVIAARKPLTILASPAYAATADPEAALLVRHLNATAGASSARWIGALSIKNYRDFIEEFFANDNDEPYTGEGQHAIEANRAVLNMAGVTHFAQGLPADTTDIPMLAAGFVPADRADIGTAEAVLYKNPAAFPKAFLVPHAVWEPAADEARAGMHDPAFDPAGTVFLAGPTPPAGGLPQRTDALQANAAITAYEATQMHVEVTTSQTSILVVTDASTPQWHTEIDGQPAPYYTANTVFKAAIVPAGTHTVTFHYRSPAIQQSKVMSLAGLGLTAALYAANPAQRRFRQRTYGST